VTHVYLEAFGIIQRRVLRDYEALAELAQARNDSTDGVHGVGREAA
jgi:hypothetical protein